MKHERTALAFAACAAGLLALRCAAQEIDESWAGGQAPGGGGASFSLVAQAGARPAVAAAAQDPDRIMALEADLAASEAEKKRLAREVEELKKRAPAAQPQAPTVAPGSDLFEALRKENAQLKEKAAALDTDKENSARSQSELAAALEKAQSELAALKSADEKQKQSLGTLVERLPAMEQEMNELRASSKEKDARLREQEKALQAMSVEIRQREHRLVKAERMTEVMEKTRADLKQVSDQEKRDMHFNMAAVYTREGKLQDAESEYLRALRLDPCDADVHFNLGILYDDHMDQKRKAAMHYRRYLKLMPDANDAETVRAWLLAIETEARE